MPRSVMTCCVAGMRRFVELLEVFRTLPDVHDMYAVGPRVTYATRDSRRTRAQARAHEANRVRE